MQLQEEPGHEEKDFLARSRIRQRQHLRRPPPAGRASHFLKAQIVAELYRLKNERKLTQAKAGALMGISQPEVSRLFKSTFREYSVDRLVEFLTAFDRDVEIVSRPRPRGRTGTRGQISFRPLTA